MVDFTFEDKNSILLFIIKVQCFPENNIMNLSLIKISNRKNQSTKFDINVHWRLFITWQQMIIFSKILFQS